MSGLDLSPQPGEICGTHTDLQEFASGQQYAAISERRLLGAGSDAEVVMREAVADEAEALRRSCGACTLHGVFDPPAGITGCPIKRRADVFMHEALEVRIPEARRQALGESATPPMPKQTNPLRDICDSGRAAYDGVTVAQMQLREKLHNLTRDQRRNYIAVASRLIAITSNCSGCHYGGAVREGMRGTACPNTNQISALLERLDD